MSSLVVQSFLASLRSARGGLYPKLYSACLSVNGGDDSVLRHSPDCACGLHTRGPVFSSKSPHIVLQIKGLGSEAETGIPLAKAPTMEPFASGGYGSSQTFMTPVKLGTYPKTVNIDEEKLWKKYFSNPCQWWDNAGRKIHLRGPDFKHKNTIEIGSDKKSAWVDGQLEAAASQLIEAGTSTMTTASEKGPCEGVNKISSGTCGHVRILCEEGQLKEALHILNQGGISVDSDTYVCLLHKCIKMKGLAAGKQVHAHIIKSGFKPSLFLYNTLVNMYVKCGSIMDAHHVFDKMPERNTVSWTVMMAGYTKNRCFRNAFKFYEQMMQEGVMPNQVTFVCVLKACASLATLEKGKEVHADIMKAGIVPDVILDTALVDMYAKCGSIEDAKGVFSSMAKRDVVSWSAMIAGYAQHGCEREALETYEQMMQEGLKPDQVSFVCACNACASLAALEKGKEVHADIMNAGIVPNMILNNSLVDMYAKCGSIEDAKGVFDNMVEQNLVSWSAMIAGYAQHGCQREALQLFERMQKEGLKPNSITFTGVLQACSHGGLVDEGKHYFVSLRQDHGLTPTVEHFGCMVDLLGRVGRLGEAEDLIDEMPVQRDAVVWKVLLGACRIHGNVEVAERAAKFIFKWDGQDATTYVLLSNIYAAAGKWDNIAKVRK